jgi:glutathione S-transferase
VITVYGYAASINVRKVLWLCDELGLAVTRDDWDGRLVRATHEPAFRALNPVGMVPVIDDGGVIVWESNAILRYLAASRGRIDLLPVAAAERARVEQWMDWQASDLNNSWRAPLQVLVRGNATYADARAVAAALEVFNANIGVIDAQLAKADFVAGAAFTVADIVIALSLVRWQAIPMVRPPYAHVSRYLDRLRSRPAFVQYGREA